MYYGLNDFEYSKDVFMSTPKLFRLGMVNGNFGPVHFWKWIFYGMYQAVLILFFCFWASSSITENGLEFGFWASG